VARGFVACRLRAGPVHRHRRRMMRPYLPSLLTRGAYILAFNLLCALVVTYVLAAGRGFAINLLYSMCIGTVAFLIIDLTRLLVWRGERPAWWQFAALVGFAVLLAQALGTMLAAWLLGEGVPSLAAISPQRGMLFTLTATVSVTYFFASRERIVRAQAAAASERARAEAVERQALQAQLQLLQAQLEPHMLFNTLANLQGLIAIDPERAQHMLDQLIQFLRATLTSSRAQTTTLAREFALVEAYLGLMQVRMGARLAYSLDLPSGLADTALPPMLLQPLVENAIGHGLEPLAEGGHVSVSARRDGMDIVLAVADNGRGPDAPAVRSGTHVGLSNTRDRLAAVYGHRATVSLTAAEPRGAVATITLPAES
jgi:sensor histidine kinase YesM